MAWRFNESDYVKQGSLDNSVSGKTTGEIEFASIGKVVLDLTGDMDGSLYGRRISFHNPDCLKNLADVSCPPSEYFDDFADRQHGRVGSIMAEPHFYLEWFSEENGRCVIALSSDYLSWDA